MLRRKAGAWLARAGEAIAAEVGRDELFILAALLLIATGFWDLWRPGSYLAPGGVLLWLALPTRARFVASSEPTTKKG